MVQLSPHSTGAASSPADSLVANGAKKAKSGGGLAKLFSGMLADARSKLDGQAKTQSVSPRSGREALEAGIPRSDGSKTVDTAGKLARNARSNSKLDAASADETSKSIKKKSAKQGSASEGSAAAGREAVNAASRAAQSSDSNAVRAGERSQEAARSLAAAAASAGAESADASGAAGGAAGTNKAKDAKNGKRADERGSSASDGELVAGQAAVLAAYRGTTSAARQNASAASEEAGEKKVEGADSKKKDKRKERIDIEVYDQRGSQSAANAAAKAAAVDGNSASGSTSEKNGSDSESSFVVNLKTGEGGSSETGGANKTTSSVSFSDAFARELRETANADIVKHASLVLKNGGEGTIRLSIKPESLGSVKIRLEMADNKIAGRIVVESDEALKAFEKEMGSLEQAFRDGGFEGASLELSVASDGTRGGSGNPRGEDAPRSFFSERFAATTYDAAAAAPPVVFARTVSDSIVNVLA